MRIEDVISRPNVPLFFVTGHTSDEVVAGRAVITDLAGNKTDVTVKSVAKIRCLCDQGPIIAATLDREVVIEAGSTLAGIA